MKLKKILTLMCCAVLLVCISVGATVAYLTSTSDVAENTFTVGNVKIKLDEANVDIYGDKIDDTRVLENEYKLIPGHEYTKDPTVTVEKGSEVSYVQMQVRVSDIAKLTSAFDSSYVVDGVFLLQNLVDWNTAWEYVGYANGIYTFNYETSVNALKADQKLPALFTTITMPDDITNENLAKLNGVKIDVVACAVQADGFDSAEDAFKSANINPWAE